jgi:hypothetical protein
MPHEREFARDVADVHGYCLKKIGAQKSDQVIFACITAIAADMVNRSVLTPRNRAAPIERILLNFRCGGSFTEICTHSEFGEFATKITEILHEYLKYVYDM